MPVRLKRINRATSDLYLGSQLLIMTSFLPAIRQGTLTGWTAANTTLKRRRYDERAVGIDCEAMRLSFNLTKPVRNELAGLQANPVTTIWRFI